MLVNLCCIKTIAGEDSLILGLSSKLPVMQRPVSEDEYSETPKILPEHPWWCKYGGYNSSRALINSLECPGCQKGSLLVDQFSI